MLAELFKTSLAASSLSSGRASSLSSLAKMQFEEMNKIESGYAQRRANIEKQMERLTKKDFVRRGTKAIENIAGKTKAFITGDENEAVQ